MPKMSYSEIMRMISDLDPDELNVLKYKWKLLSKKDAEAVSKQLDENEELLQLMATFPKYTITGFNALIQAESAMTDALARKEWADRVEGKTVQRSVVLGANEQVNDAEQVKQILNGKFDVLEKQLNQQLLNGGDGSETNDD